MLSRSAKKLEQLKARLADDNVDDEMDRETLLDELAEQMQLQTS